MFALIKGIFSEMLEDSLVLRSVWDLEITAERLGTSNTSSKVKPSLISKFSLKYLSHMAL
jgi:hypothetical protein